MAKIIPMVVSVSSQIKRQSRIAVKAARTLPESDLLFAEAEVDGLLPLEQEVYAIRDSKADPKHNTPEVIAEVEANREKYREARSLIAARTAAKKIVSSARARYQAMLRAEAEVAAEESEAHMKSA